MRRISVFVAAALLCCSLPVGVSAEGFLPGLPSLGGSACTPGHNADWSVAAKLGYLGYNKGLVFDRTAVGTVLGGSPECKYQYPIEGLWAGVSVGAGRQRGSFVICDPADSLCLSLGGSWLFASNKDAIETASVFPDSPAYRTWRPNTQWYTLYATVSRCAVSNFSLIGGFRYESFSTKFVDPSEVQGLRSDPTDEAELTLSSFIPYVGAVTRWGDVEVGVLGFPYVPGTIGYRQTLAASVRYEGSGNYRNGYFLEAFAEWGRQMQAVHLSAFATYTLLHAVGEFDLSRTEGGTETAPYAFGFDRQNWIAGGKAVIGFNSPL